MEPNRKHRNKLIACIWAIKEYTMEKDGPPQKPVLRKQVRLFANPWTVALQASVHGIFQVIILEWVITSCSRRSPQPRDQTHSSCTSCIGRQVLYHYATWEALKWNIAQPRKRNFAICDNMEDLVGVMLSETIQTKTNASFTNMWNINMQNRRKDTDL